MKNWKQNAFFGLAVIIAFGFAFVACDDGDGKDEQAEFREATINLLEGETKENGQPYTAKVEGTLTQTQWNGVADKIETAINGAFGNATGLEGFALKNKFRDVFGRENVKIIVGKRPDGKTWETVGDSITLYINIDEINKADFQQKIVDAVTSMDDGGTEIN
jgi:hypothetical protein